MNKIIIKFKNLLICFCIISLNSCTKNQNIVPYVYVDQYINVSLPSYSSLNSIGGWANSHDPSNRIRIDRLSYNQVRAHHSHCPYNANNPCGKATVDSTNSFIECACDSSRYQLFDGLVIKGPASYSLKNYQTSFNVTSNEIHIFN